MSDRSKDNPVLRLLREGRARIRKGWTKGAFARDRAGRSVQSWHEEAKEWCALGALNADGPPFVDAWSAARYLKRSLLGKENHVDSFNDRDVTTKQDVLDLYDRAIALCEEET